MAKTKYNKVEEAISKGIYDMKVDQILKETSLEKQEEGNKTSPVQMMLLIVHHLKWMKRKDKDIYKNIKIKKQEILDLAKLIEEARNDLRKEELTHLKKIYKKVVDYKEKTYPSPIGEEQVEEEKEKHIYKRHNVYDNWTPLDVPKT